MSLWLSGAGATAGRLLCAAMGRVNSVNEGSSVNPRRGAESSGMLAYMRRTTVKLPDDLDAKLRHEAQAQGKTISELTREAIEAHLDHKTGSRRRLMAGGVGHSGHPDISERIEEILRAEVAR